MLVVVLTSMVRCGLLLLALVVLVLVRRVVKVNLVWKCIGWQRIVTPVETTLWQVLEGNGRNFQTEDPLVG